MLGFDSNLIPNLNIVVFQPYPEEDSKYSEKSGSSHVIQCLPLGIPQIFGKFILTGLISCRIQQGSLQIPNTSIIRRILKEKPELSGNSTSLSLGFTTYTEYIDYSPDLERKTQIIGKIVKRSSEMAKFAIPAQEFSENSEKSL